MDAGFIIKQEKESENVMPIPQKNESVHTLSAKDRIYNTVCDWIITGVLKSGEKILDSELAKYFDVSRTPVREAIQMLERQKLVKVIPSRGTIVADIEIEDTEKCYRLLAEIQAYAAEEACERISEDQLQALRECYNRFSEACKAGTSEQLLKEDACFHEMIVKASGNEYAEDFSRILLLHIQRVKYHYFHVHVNPIRSVDHHEQILQAFAVRDKALAKAVMREHWLLSMEYSLDIVRKMQ